MVGFKFQNAVSISAGGIGDEIEDDGVARFTFGGNMYRRGRESDGFKFFNIGSGIGTLNERLSVGNKFP